MGLGGYRLVVSATALHWTAGNGLLEGIGRLVDDVLAGAVTKQYVTVVAATRGFSLTETE